MHGRDRGASPLARSMLPFADLGFSARVFEKAVPRLPPSLAFPSSVATLSSQRTGTGWRRMRESGGAAKSLRMIDLFEFPLVGTSI